MSELTPEELQSKPPKRRLELMREAEIPPLEAFKLVVKQDYGSIEDLCRMLGYVSGNQFYTTFSKEYSDIYNYTFLKNVAKEIGVEKDWLKWYLGIDDKIIKQEIVDNLENKVKDDAKSER